MIQMFRRSTSSAALSVSPEEEAPESVAGARHTRRAQQQQASNEAALKARLERVHRRLAEVGSVQVTGRVHAIDNDAARRDPLTRPFALPDGAPMPRHRTATPTKPTTAAMPRPA
ncbi:hypothetical protein [Actinomycetospora sp. NBRC 106375]|uniref:hypothetical protein n=1 Tax=Actinomycetospora sp. NBRC 106375 TaxID=3032207 RepID=UPI002556ABCD|nr:hypothetical protein [Actinomycetospora sp. NBRC 106375]